MCGTAHELLAHTHTHLVGAVGDGAVAVLVAHGTGRPLPAWQVAGLAEVTMAAGHTDHRPGRVDTRAGHHPFVHCLLQPKDVAAHVAHGGKAAHQSAPGLRHRNRSEVTRITAQDGPQRRGRHHAVPVGVDQAGHEGAALAFDHLGTGCGRRVQRSRRDLRNGVALDQHIRRA